MKLYSFVPLDGEGAVIIAARTAGQAITILQAEKDLEDYSTEYDDPVRIVKAFADGKIRIISDTAVIDPE